MTSFRTPNAEFRILKKEEWFHADGFPIAVERRDPQEPFGLHAHEFSEIVIATGGTGLHVTGEDSWQLSTGDTFVIGGSRPHDYVNMEHLRLINILFDQDELTLPLRDLPTLPGYHALFHLEPRWRKRHQFKSRLRLSVKQLTTAVELVDELDGELNDRSSGFGFVSTALFMQLVAHLSRCYGRSQNANSRALLRIAETIAYLETHYAESVKLEELICIASMSRRSFLRAFETATGFTPIAYQLQLRINRAAELLVRTTENITNIAYEVGFNDSNYFARQFRKHHGMSPRDYRRQSS
jgi:AraC-like DNA-binding protein